MRASVRVEGLDDFARALDALGEAAADPDPALREIAQYAAGQVSGRAPRLTGELAGSARPVVDQQRAAVEVSADHAGFVNYGTRFVSPANFIAAADPAVETYSETAIDQFLSTTIRQRGLA